MLSLSGLALLCYFSWMGICFVAYCTAAERTKRGQTIGGKVAHDRGAWHLISTAAMGKHGWTFTSTVLVVAQLGVSTSYVDQVHVHVHILVCVEGLACWLMTARPCRGMLVSASSLVSLGWPEARLSTGNAHPYVTPLTEGSLDD